MRLILALLVAVSCLAGPSRAADLTVFSAASLKTALDNLAAVYTAETGQRLTLSYAGSSALARQIQRGAPADVFLSANPGWMDTLDAAGLLAPGTRRDLLGNRLVIVGRETVEAESLTPDSPLAAWLEGGRLAMALVDAVPAGIYGKAGLEALGLWDDVAPRVAQADNVRAALALVALGAAPLGVVYATDARAEPRVHVRATFPPGSHPPIIYPVAALAGHAEDAAPFLDFLASATAGEIFERHGFAVLAD